jgi:hypothetical protein
MIHRSGLVVLGPRVGITGKLDYPVFHIAIIIKVMQLAHIQRGGAIASYIAKNANNSAVRRAQI